MPNSCLVHIYKMSNYNGNKSELNLKGNEKVNDWSYIFISKSPDKVVVFRALRQFASLIKSFYFKSNFIYFYFQRIDSRGRSASILS